MVTSLKAGAVVGDCTVRGLLFHTSAFSVYSAVDHRTVSVCLLCTDASERRPTDAEFTSSLEALTTLRVGALPRILRGGRDQARSWIITEAIGATKACWTPGSAPLHWLRGFSVAKRIAESLDRASEVSAYHGSLEPACVRQYENGRLCLVGVGVASLFGFDRNYLRQSPRYLAAERLADAPAAPSEAADIYSLGMWMLAALSGQEPFAGVEGDALVTVAKHGNPALVVTDQIPHELWELLSRMTAKDPEQRHGPWKLARHLMELRWQAAFRRETEEGRDPQLAERSYELVAEYVDQVGPDQAKEFFQQLSEPPEPRSGDEDDDEEIGGDNGDEDRIPAVDKPSARDPAEPPGLIPLRKPLGHSVANDVKLSWVWPRSRTLLATGASLLAAACILIVWIASRNPGAARSAVPVLGTIPSPPIAQDSDVAPPSAPESELKPERTARRAVPPVMRAPSRAELRGFFNIDPPMRLERRGEK